MTRMYGQRNELLAVISLRINPRKALLMVIHTRKNLMHILNLESHIILSPCQKKKKWETNIRYHIIPVSPKKIMHIKVYITSIYNYAKTDNILSGTTWPYART